MADRVARREDEDVRALLLPLLAAAALLLFGLWMRLPTVGYDGPATQDAYNRFAVDRFVYSDIASLYFRDGLANHPRPYFDYPLEYPIGTGLLVYLLNEGARSMGQYFVLTSLAMTFSALWITVLVPRFPRGRPLLFACSPALALYVNLNWDMWGVLLMVVALLLFARERHGWAAVALAAAAWTKFFPLVFLPFLVAERLRTEGWREAGKFAAMFTFTSAAINAPLLVLAPRAWWYFFDFNATREGDLNLWTLFFGLAPQAVREINALGAASVAAAVVVLLVFQWRRRSGAWLWACSAMLAWFFFVGKVYSPQYALWIVALLAVAGTCTALAVAWSALDLAYFTASFVTLGLSQYGEAQGWFVTHTLQPAAVLREGLLLVVVVWCIKQMRAPAPEP